MSDQDYDADVIVAGAGPSGLVTACEAALGGTSVIILEKRNGPTWSRAGVLNTRVMELLASRGIMDRFMDRAMELHNEPRGSKGLWAGLGPLHVDALDSDYNFVLWFPQIEAEKLLAERFEELGGELRLVSEVVGLSQDDEGVDVRYLHDGAERTLRGRYLVGADGNRSAVREAVGIGRTGTPARRIAVNVDAFVPNPYSTQLTVAHSANGWAMTYPLREGLTRFAFIDAASTHEPPDRPLGLEEAKAMLRRVHGTDYGITEISAINRFHDALYVADQMRERRVFLVGESVRVHYPAGGVGMQFCIQDAFNLGWKLAAAVTNRAPEGLLDSYVTERRPEIDAFLDQIRRQCALQFGFDDDHVALKRFIELAVLPNPEINLQICEELSGLSAAYPAPEGAAPIVGRRLPNIEVRDNRRAFELLHSADFVLLDLTDARELPAVADGVRLTVASGPPSDRALLAGIASVLVRPDGHVAWAGTQPLSAYLPERQIRDWLNLESSKPVFSREVQFVA